MLKFSHITVKLKLDYSNERDEVTLAVVFFLPFLSVINAIHSKKRRQFQRFSSTKLYKYHT